VEYLDSVWQIGIIALVAGALIGALAYRLFAPSVKEAGKIKTELDDAREELNGYRTSVNQHFGKTAELVNELTQNYVRVYQHLAQGAQTLGDSRTFNNLLEQHQGRVSIAVDEETDASGKPADDPVVEQAVTQAKAEETIDEHAEPFTDPNAGATDSADSESDTVKTRTGGPSGKTGAAAVEPVLNVDALEQAAADADPAAENRLSANSAVPEGEEKVEVRTTTH
jgi:uncharacterized membrane-anchored protein YhcB (DUF1043 family)